MVDAYRALTEPPTPGVSLYENWIFDDQGIDPGNDDDGRVDSGERLHLAVELFNRSGSAENVTATLVAQAQGAVMQDPYVTITTDTVTFGDIGPFARADNGLIWDDEGVITGVETPFVFTVSPDCPNDHVIPFVMTTTFLDGWDEEHTTYTRVSRFNYVVQRGKNVPSVISENTELTSDEYWIVGGPVLIEAGATLTIKEGTRVQWGAISDDPYNPGPQSGYVVVRGSLIVEGTEDNPVSMFPSYLVSGQETKISVEDAGTTDIRYATIRNPDLVKVDDIDHVYFDWDAFSSRISAATISNSVFHKLHGDAISAGVFDTCLFDASHAGLSGSINVVDCTFLQDNEESSPLSITPPLSFKTPMTDASRSLDLFYYHLEYREGTDASYVVLPMEWTSLDLAETIANYYGGNVASVGSADDEEYLQSYVASSPAFGWDDGVDFFIGLSDNDGEYAWTDGSPLSTRIGRRGIRLNSLRPLSMWCGSCGGVRRERPLGGGTNIRRIPTGGAAEHAVGGMPWYCAFPARGLSMNCSNRYTTGRCSITSKPTIRRHSVRTPS